MEHFQYPALPPFWLGCFPALGPVGFDNDLTPGGASAPKVSVGFPAMTPAPPLSACAAIPVDCFETAGDGMRFGQDECYGDGSDACLSTFKSFPVCGSDALAFTATSCPSAIQQRVVILSAAAMGLLQKELIDTLGLETARRVALRFGYADGYHDAVNLREQTAEAHVGAESGCCESYSVARLLESLAGGSTV
jgi:hypothetical protein